MVIPYATVGENWWDSHFISLDYGFGKSSASAHLHVRTQDGKLHTIGEFVAAHLPAYEFAHEVVNRFVLPPIQGQRRRILAVYLDPSEGEKPSSMQEQDQDHLQDQDHEQVISSSDDSPGSVVCTLPIRDGSDYLVRTSEVKQWQEQFPEVNIGSELAQMRAWLVANAPRRKTRRRMDLFIVRWLERAKQNVTIRKPTVDNSLSTKNYRAGTGAVCEDGSAAL